MTAPKTTAPTGDDTHQSVQHLLAGGRSLAQDHFRELLLHLTQDCPACAALLQTFDPTDAFPLFADRASPPARLEDILEHGAATESTVRTTLARQTAFEREGEDAQAALRTLLELSDDERREQIRLHDRFRTRALCEALLQEASRTGFNTAAAAVELAELAIFAAAHLDREFYGRGAVADVAARAWATLGNALRLTDDLRASERAFQRSALILAVGSGDPLARAKILTLKSTLRVDQRRFEAGDRLLEEAVATYLAAGETHLAGRTLLKRALLFEYQAEWHTAIALLEKAQAWIDPEREPMLEMIARHNLLGLLAVSGQAATARQLMSESEELYRRFEAPWLVATKIWLEGKIAFGLGELEPAEERLDRARDLYSKRQEVYNWSLVSLDLALVYVTMGRGAELRALADAVFTAFQSLDIHREAFAALLLFYGAAKADEVTAAVVRDLISTFKRHPYSPATNPS